MSWLDGKSDNDYAKNIAEATFRLKPLRPAKTPTNPRDIILTVAMDGSDDNLPVYAWQATPMAEGYAWDAKCVELGVDPDDTDRHIRESHRAWADKPNDPKNPWRAAKPVKDIHVAQKDAEHEELRRTIGLEPNDPDRMPDGQSVVSFVRGVRAKARELARPVWRMMERGEDGLACRALGIRQSADMLIMDTTNHFRRDYMDDGVRGMQMRAMSPGILGDYLLARTSDAFDEENRWRKKVHMSGTVTAPKKLTTWQTAVIMSLKHPIVNICASDGTSDPDTDMLAMYNAGGRNRGLYTSDMQTFRRAATVINPNLTDKDFAELRHYLADDAPHMPQCKDADLIAVNNGIVDYRTKQFHDFDPSCIFLSKSRVDYVEHPKNPVIDMPDGKKWDVKSWMDTLSDDKDVVKLLWQSVGACLRPHVPWNRSLWFYSTKGNNGKGTLLSLMRNLVGTGSYASLSLTDFSRDFMLEPLTRVSAVLTDENDVGAYIDRAANLKAATTHDSILINRKFRDPISFQFWGLIVQCVNEPPRVKDRSDSFYRRQIFVPFDKSFEGHERRYIKEDYLKRRDVLEYVLWYVINGLPDYDSFDVPESCTAALDEYKRDNDPVRLFWDEFKDRLSWDLVPSKFLFDLYSHWYQQTNPSGRMVSAHAFSQQLRQLIETDTTCAWTWADAPVRSANRMDKPEPLIVEYDLKLWKSRKFPTSSDINLVARPSFLQPTYRGIVRNPSIAATTTGAHDAADDTAGKPTGVTTGAATA